MTLHPGNSARWRAWGMAGLVAAALGAGPLVLGSRSEPGAQAATLATAAPWVTAAAPATPLTAAPAPRDGRCASRRCTSATTACSTSLWWSPRGG